MGMDVSNLLASKNGSTAQITYTATQDCWIVFQVVYSSRHFWGYIDDVVVYELFDNGGNGVTTASAYFLRKGSTAKITCSGYHASQNFNIYAYGTK